MHLGEPEGCPVPGVCTGDESEMTLTGPDRDETFQWDPSESELMKAMILAGVQIQMPIFREEKRGDTP